MVMQFFQETVNTFVTPVIQTGYARNEIIKTKKDQCFQRTDETMGRKNLEECVLD